MAQRAAYDEDFFNWTQEQAALLRELPHSLLLPNALDLTHIAEEIEDMGKSELNTVLSSLEQIFIHLIKLTANGLEAHPSRGWVSEIFAFQRRARRGFSPGVRQLIKLEELWQNAFAGATNELALCHESVPSLPAFCPFILDNLLDRQIDVNDMLDAIARAANLSNSQ